jgi:ribosome-binding factor A
VLCWPAMGSARMRRVNEVLKQVIGDAIANELQDPRIGFVTVTAVDTSPDLRSARVHVSVLGAEEDRERSLAALTSSHGVLQREIAVQTHMKRTPTLSFHYDEGPERAVRLSRLLDDDVEPEE